MAKQNSKKKQANEEPKRESGPVSQPIASMSPEESVTSFPIEIAPGNLIIEQNREIQRQDEQLVDLEASILNLRDASVSINEEVTLQSGLLEDMHVQVDRVQGRQIGTQERLRQFMRQNGTCKLWSMIAVLAFILVFLLVALK